MIGKTKSSREFKAGARFVRGALALLLLLVFSVPQQGCLRRKPQTEQSPVSKCLQSLNKIPMLAGVLRSRGKDPEFAADSKPFEGLQLALTINGMVRGSGEPEGGVDNWCERENSRENFIKLRAALKRNNIPPTVAFIQGSSMDVDILGEWLKSGNLIGNMTFSRKKARKWSPQDFIADIQRNAEALLPVLSTHGSKMQYFRYPALKVGKNADSQAQMEQYISEMGYQNVPATINAYNREFGQIYCEAAARGEEQCLNLVSAHFKTLLLDSTLKARKFAKKRVGRDAKHILMVEADQFICDNLGDILDWYRSLGAQFISVQEALEDPLYKMTDDRGKPAARSIIRITKRAQTAGARQGD